MKQNTYSPSPPQKQAPGNFREMEATELYCPRCRQAVPVRKRLLLILPDGEKYEYRCAACFESVGTKMVRKEQSRLIY